VPKSAQTGKQLTQYHATKEASATQPHAHTKILQCSGKWYHQLEMELAVSLFSAIHHCHYSMVIFHVFAMIKHLLAH
jgi:hypothetical protein